MEEDLNFNDLLDTIEGLEEDIAQIVRVAWENPNNLLQFVKDNYRNPNEQV